MNTKLLPYIFYFLFTLLMLSACSDKAGSTAHDQDDVDYYTCTMHPSVRSHDPHGRCPICSMDLVPVAKRTVDISVPAERTFVSDQPTEFTVPLERQQLIGVTYAEVKRTPLHSTIRTIGTVAVNKRRHWDYVARVDGYIHNLRVFSPGEIVAKDQILMDLYSPDLTATQNEYIGLLRMRDQAEKEGTKPALENAEHLLSAAHQRLAQWNLSDTQIDELQHSRVAIENLPLVSPFRGVVQAVDVDQGRHVSVGDHLVDIADLTSVWVWAEFYQEEIPRLKTGMALSISSAALPGIFWKGKISLIDPFINEQTRTGRVQIEVENPDLILRPAMYVDIELTLDGGEGLTVPLNAVLPTGKHNILFVNKGNGKLEPRYIEIKGKFGDLYAVASGLKEGERVVSSANFLIDAESKIQGAVKSW